jgi:acetyl esterase/lipase
MSVVAGTLANAKIDFLPRDLAYKIALSYAGSNNTLNDVSPINVDMNGFPPLLISAGDCECLIDQVRVLITKCKAAGVEVEEHIEEGMVHVFPLFAAFSKKNSAPVQAFQKAAVFMNRVLKNGGGGEGGGGGDEDGKNMMDYGTGAPKESDITRDSESIV